MRRLIINHPSDHGHSSPRGRACSITDLERLGYFNMRVRFLLVVAMFVLASCGGGSGPAFEPRTTVTVDRAVARVDVDNVLARVDFSPGPEAFGQASSIAWTFTAKPARSAAMLEPTLTNSEGSAVTFAPDVAGTYTLQAAVNYGAGLPVGVGTASVTAIHAMSFFVGRNPSYGAFEPTPDVFVYALVQSDAPIASVEGFLDGRSLGALTAPNTSSVCFAQHGPCPAPSPAYGYAIPQSQLAGTHTMRWVVTGAPGTGIAGEGTVLIGRDGLINTGPGFDVFGPFAGNP